MDNVWGKGDRVIKKLPTKIWKKLLPVLPMVTIELIIKNKHGVLLAKRDINPFKGYWHTPGGFLRFGESFEAAAKRIAKDETGLTVKIMRYGKFYNLYKKDPRGHIISLVIVAKPVGGKLYGSIQGEELKFFKRFLKK